MKSSRLSQTWSWVRLESVPIINTGGKRSVSFLFVLLSVELRYVGKYPFVLQVVCCIMLMIFFFEGFPLIINKFIEQQLLIESLFVFYWILNRQSIRIGLEMIYVDDWDHVLSAQKNTFFLKKQNYVSIWSCRSASIISKMSVNLDTWYFACEVQIWTQTRLNHESFHRLGNLINRNFAGLERFLNEFDFSCRNSSCHHEPYPFWSNRFDEYRNWFIVKR